MNIFKHFEQKIKNILEQSDIKAKNGEKLELNRITVETPRDGSHGDLSTNAAMVLAKTVGVSPRQFAQNLAELLQKDESIDNIEVAGPGFINLKLKDKFWQQILEAILQAGPSYGRSRVGANKRVNVEYVSANPTGPIHIGHCRGAIVGDVIANLLSFTGHEVIKEYYINDAGGQILTLARSAFHRYKEALGHEIGTLAPGLYPGDYLIPVGENLARDYGTSLLEKDEEEALTIIKNRVVDSMMDMIRDDLSLLNIHHDVFFSEQRLHEGDAAAVRKAINELTLNGYVYKGTLPPPKGQTPTDWENREQTLFRSTEAGDDQDRPLIKSDGSYTYLAADVAYFYDKYTRGFNEMIYVLGADHSGYVKRLEAIAKAVSGGKAKLTAIICQMVKFLQDGIPIEMSKRAGSFVTVRDVINAVGCDSTRFMMLYRKCDAPLDFDYNKVTEKSKDNPVFYVQYASARCHSILRQARETFNAVDFSKEAMIEARTCLTHESEINLLRKLAEYPRIIEQATKYREPHRLAFYLYDLASYFHSLWNKGNEDPSLRFVRADNQTLTTARLGLVQATADILASGLKIIGVEAPTEMN
ncbi:arginine--tRNA ligase [Bartonella sp. DGB2]|uniref:arginine--tRNA ligase n=1 Tax=Bartonella sp. DGB2 TaxID=3388426 RepID=UPI00398FDBBC